MEEDIKVLEQLVEEHKKLGDISEETRISQPLYKIIIQAIENLIKRNKELEEDNYVYHQLMRIQNAREYRSKFLKDFKEEYGQNVMPDYDEIYKRYDKMKKKIKELEKEFLQKGDK